MPTTQTKGITVKIDATLHAEIKAYLEQNEMTMSEFIALAVQDELHPKIQQEVRNMENMRTLAFQVPESLFLRVKEYLARNNMTQKDFVIGLIEKELDRDEKLLHQQEQGQEGTEEEQEGSPVDAPVADSYPEGRQPEYDPQQEKEQAVGGFEGSFDSSGEEQDNSPGVTPYNAENVNALSWTLNQETAEWFAHRFGEQGTVYEAQINKEHICAVFLGRQESEVIVDPKYLMEISPVQGLEQSAAEMQML